MRLIRSDRSLICHEYGHYLTARLLGYGESLSRLEFYSDPFDFKGSNRYEFIKVENGSPVIIKPTKEENLKVLYGGVVACQLLDLTGKRLSGTDKEKIFFQTTATERRQIEREVYNLLYPYRNLLTYLTDITYNYLIKEDDYIVYIRREVIENWIKEFKK